MSEIKQLTLNGKNYLFVPVPDWANIKLMWIKENEVFISESCSLAWSGNPPEPSHDEWHTLVEERLLVGSNYQFLTTTTDITEEQAAEIGITYNDLAEHGITGRHAIIQIL